jgi:hypothetical protein
MTASKAIGRKGIGPAPDRCTPEMKQAWDDLVRLVEPPGFLIWRDRVWMELTAWIVAYARHRDSLTPEERSNVCHSLKGLTLGPDCLPKLGLDFDWLVIPDDEKLSIMDLVDLIRRD